MAASLTETGRGERNVAGRPSQAVEIVEERALMIAVSDGVKLRTDVFRPAGTGTHPTILHRLPYGPEVTDFHSPLPFVEHGYAVVVQQCRGCSGSEGVFEPYPSDREGHDGHDAIDWIIRQRWSDGHVGMMGVSYAGLTQLAAGETGHPNLDALCPAATLSGSADGFPFLERGVLAHDFVVGWAAFMAARSLERAGQSHPDLAGWPSGEEMGAALVGDGSPELRAAVGMRIIETLTPLMQRDPRTDLFPEVIPWLGPWLERLGQGWPEGRPHAPLFHRFRTPALHITGWYDATLKGTLANFQGLAAHAGTSQARSGQRLIIGPWDHWSADRIQSGDVPGVAGLERFFEDEIHEPATNPMIRFFDYWVRGHENGVPNEAPIQLFVLGAGEWRDENEWPLARTEFTPFYLNGDRSTADGAASLSAELPSDQAPDEYAHDPRDLVPTWGGPRVFLGIPGPLDQSEIAARDDVLAYSTARLDRDLEVTGPVSLELWVSSSVDDFDIVARLIDVDANGVQRNLCEGVTRSRFADGAERRREPGAVYRYVIDLWATSNVFKIGHRIGLHLSSSSFPRIQPDRSPAASANLVEPVASVQRVHHDRLHPSRLVLPVIPESTEPLSGT